MSRTIHSRLLTAGLACLALSLGACGAAEVDAGKPGVESVRIPSELGQLQKTFQGGADGPLVIVIGESHVNLDVQLAVADVLGYLRAAYGVRAVAFEGFKAGESLPTPIVAGSLDARRAAARADLLGRRINGVEYAALAYPDLTITGASNMEAYRKHGQALKKRGEERARQWAEDFQSFMLEVIAHLPLSEVEAKELRLALEGLQQEGDLAAFIRTLDRLLKPHPEAQAQLAELEKRSRGDDSCSETRDDPLMAERDRWLAANVLDLADGSAPIALVVGRCHLEGVERELAAKSVSHVSFVVRGADTAGFDAGDAEVYERWTLNEPGFFESWLSDHKPGPQLARESLRIHTTVLNALFYAESKLSEGTSLDAVSSKLAAFGLPADFLQESYFIENGRGIAFQWNGRSGFFYSSTEPFPEGGFPGFEVERDTLGDFHYLRAWGNGEDGGPPSGPISRTTGPPGEPRDPVRALIEKQRERNPGAITFELEERDGFFHRRIGAGPWTLLLMASAEEVREQVEAFQNAHDPAEGTLAAQRLAGMLLVDLEAGDFENRRQLILVLDDGLPLDLPLPLIAELSAEGPASFRTIPQLQSTRLLKPTTKDEEDAAVAALEPILTQAPHGVAPETMMVWIADTLRSRPEYAGHVERLRELGYRIGEVPTATETLVILGQGSADWSVTLADGQRRTADSLHPAEYAALLAINAEVGDGRTKQLHTLKTAEGEALAELEDLLKDIAEREGDPLDEVLRRRTLDKLEREKAERNPALAATSPAFFESLRKSSAPTILSST